MARNILLTSLSTADDNLPVRYFYIQDGFRHYYCDAVLDAEAGIKAMLAQYDIDEIIVIGGTDTYDKEDDLKPVPLTNGRALYSEDMSSLSSYGLLQYWIARYTDELKLDRKEEDGRLPGEVREKLIRFIRDFQEGNAGLKRRNCGLPA